MKAFRAKKTLLRSALINLGIFAAILLVFVVAANWPAIATTITYQESPVTPTPTSETPIEGPDIISIPRIGVEAPLVMEEPIDTIPRALGEGVAHLKDTALPGFTGNTVLIGHSSDYSWKKNPYSAIFSQLPRLKAGDTFSVRYKQENFEYTVTSTKVVRADDVSVLNQTSDAQITLLTCYPIGTTWKRFIVVGTLNGSAKKPATDVPAPSLSEIKIR